MKPVKLIAGVVRRQLPLAQPRSKRTFRYLADISGSLHCRVTVIVAVWALLPGPRRSRRILRRIRILRQWTSNLIVLADMRINRIVLSHWALHCMAELKMVSADMASILVDMPLNSMTLVCYALSGNSRVIHLQLLALARVNARVPLLAVVRRRGLASRLATGIPS